MSKRFLSILLALSLVFVCVPAFTLSASAGFELTDWNSLLIISCSKDIFSINEDISPSISVSDLESEHIFAPDDVTITPNSFSTTGKHTVTVSVAERTCEFEVWVGDGTHTPLGINSVTTNEEYLYAGEALAFSGCSAEIVYNDGFTDYVTEDIEYPDVTVPHVTEMPYDNYDYNVEFEYMGLTYSEDYEVYDVENGGKLESDAFPRVCVVNESVEFLDDEFSINVILYDFEFSKVTIGIFVDSSDVSVEPSVFTHVGWQTVTYSYRGASYQCPIYVGDGSDDIFSIEASSNSRDEIYCISGESLDLSDITLKVYRCNGTVDTVTSGFSCVSSVLTGDGVQDVGITYGDFTGTIKVTVLDLSLTNKYSLFVSYVKSFYIVNEELDLDMISAGLYGPTDDYGFSQLFSINDIECDTTIFTTTGDKNVTFSWHGLTDEKSISVGDGTHTPYSIYYNEAPDRSLYIIGDTFDLSGASIGVKYNDGESDYISDGLTCEPAVATESGWQTITISCPGTNETITDSVYVSPVPLELSVRDMPDKTFYSINESFDASGLVLTLKPSRGYPYNEQSIYSGYTVPETVFTTTGWNTITVSCYGLETSLQVYVGDGSNATYAVEVNSSPDKYYYMCGESLDITGLSLNLLKNNGESEYVTTGFTCDIATASGHGEQEVTVSYGEFSDTFEIFVVDTFGKYILEIYGLERFYTVGDTIDLSSLTCYVSEAFDDDMMYNTYQLFTVEDFQCDTTELTSAGEVEIEFSWKGLTGKVCVQVGDGTSTPYSLTVDAYSVKDRYYLGDTLDSTGLEVTLIKNDGTQEDITSGYTCTPTTLTQTGWQEIEVSVPGIDEKRHFDVFVLDKSESDYILSVNYEPDTTVYEVGDTFDARGLSLCLSATQDDSGYYSYFSYGYVCPETVFTTTGWHTVPITYGEFSTTVSVYVVDGTDSVHKIEIEEEPDKILYYAGDSVDMSGMELRLYKNDETTSLIKTGFICSPAVLTGSGWQDVTVSYGTNTDTFKVYVNDRSVGDYVCEFDSSNSSCAFMNEPVYIDEIAASICIGDKVIKSYYIDSNALDMDERIFTTPGTKTTTASFLGMEGQLTFYVGDGTATPYMIYAHWYQDDLYRVEPGEAINNRYIMVTARYNDGTSEDVRYYSEFSNAPTEPGIQRVTVTYGDLTTQFEVFVVSPDGIESTRFAVSETMISGIDCNVTYASFMQGVQSQSVLKLYKGATEITDNSALVGTGMVLKVFSESGDLLSERTLCVTGDNDGDGKVTTTDARLALRKAAKLDTFTDVQTEASDVDGTAGISTTDARMLLRVAAHLDEL